MWEMLQHQELDEKQMQIQFWTQIKGKRTVQAIADVVPFYIAWFICGFLMIERKMGRQTMVIYTMVICFLEV